MTALTSAIESPIRAVDDRLLERQLALMCRLSPSALRGGIGAAAVMGWAAATQANLTVVVGWILLLVAISFGRARLQSAFVRDASRFPLRRWRDIMFAGLAVNGLVWGLPAISFAPEDPAKQTVLAIMTIGVAASAHASLAPVRGAYTALILPFLAPIALCYLFRDENYRVLAIGIMLFIFAMMQLARRQYDSMTDLLRLQIDLQEQVAQRERTEAELRDAKSDAEAANRAKSQFLANMSHELRTPLNAILGVSELLILESGGKQLKYAHMVRGAGSRLLRIIGDILDLARLEACALRIATAEFSPRAVTNDVVELLAEQAARKNITIRSTIEATLPECAASDAGRIQQVLSNLVDNAIKFTEHGSIDIRVQAREPDRVDNEPRVMLRWEVSDAGPGIPSEAKARLFKPFSQIDASATRKFSGAGLGLAISRELVEALGGGIGVDSEPGAGSTFWFEVPVTVGSADTPLTPAETANPRRTGRVLIVEDNPMNRELAAELLQTTGCSVATASDGEEALIRLAEERFDLVLMDWHMPKLDGLSATRRLRDFEQAHGLPRVPVIALTASVLPGDREACEAAGMDDFIAKPFAFAELATTLDRWLPA